VTVTGHPDLKVCPFSNAAFELLSYLTGPFPNQKKTHVIITGASGSSVTFSGGYLCPTCDNTADSLPAMAPNHLSYKSELTVTAFYRFLSPGKS
jgi:hypothetical protein